MAAAEDFVRGILEWVGVSPSVLRNRTVADGVVSAVATRLNRCSQ